MGVVDRHRVLQSREEEDEETRSVASIVVANEKNGAPSPSTVNRQPTMVLGADWRICCFSMFPMRHSKLPPMTILADLAAIAAALTMMGFFFVGGGVKTESPH